MPSKPSKRRSANTQITPSEETHCFARAYGSFGYADALKKKGLRFDTKLIDGLSKEERNKMFSFSDTIGSMFSILLYVGVFWCDFKEWMITMVIFHFSMDAIQFTGQLYYLDCCLPTPIAIYFEEATVACNPVAVERYCKPFQRLGYSVLTAALVSFYAVSTFRSFHSPSTLVAICAALNRIGLSLRAYRRTSDQYKRKLQQKYASEGRIHSECILEAQTLKIMSALCPSVYWDSRFLPPDLQISRSEMLRHGGCPECKKFIIEMLEMASQAKPLPRVQGDSNAITLCEQWDQLQIVVSAAETAIKLDLWEPRQRDTANRYLKQAVRAKKLFLDLITEVLGHNHQGFKEPFRALIEVDRRIVRAERSGERWQFNKAVVASLPGDIPGLGGKDNEDLQKARAQLYPGSKDEQSADSSADDTTSAEKSEVEYTSECICCFEQTAIVVFSRCGHLAYCKSCRRKALKRELGSEWDTVTSFARRLRRPLKCPFCRVDSQTVELSKFTGVVFAS